MLAGRGSRQKWSLTGTGLLGSGGKASLRTLLTSFASLNCWFDLPSNAKIQVKSVSCIPNQEVLKNIFSSVRGIVWGSFSLNVLLLIF